MSRDKKDPLSSHLDRHSRGDPLPPVDDCGESVLFPAASVAAGHAHAVVAQVVGVVTEAGRAVTAAGPSRENIVCKYSVSIVIEQHNV